MVCLVNLRLPTRVAASTVAAHGHTSPFNVNSKAIHIYIAILNQVIALVIMLQPGPHPIRHFPVFILYQSLDKAPTSIIMPTASFIPPRTVGVQPTHFPDRECNYASLPLTSLSISMMECSSPNSKSCSPSL